MTNITVNNTAQISDSGPNVLIILLDSLILVLSLSGNTLVIYTISKERKLQTTCNYLLLNLAICDIIVVTLGTSIDVMLQFTKSKWILGLTLCRTLSPTMTMFYISGSLIMVVISLDRYKMFVHPLKARHQRKYVKYSVIVVHLISLSCVIPFAVFSTIADGYCYDVWPAIWYRKGYTVFLFLMQYALPLLIMGVAYTGVSLSLHRSKSTFKNNFNSRGDEKNETTSTKSLVGAGSSTSSFHPKNDAGQIMVELHTAALEPLGDDKGQPRSSVAQPYVSKKNGTQIFSEFESKTRNERSIETGDAGRMSNKKNKPTRGKHFFISCRKEKKKELSDDVGLISTPQASPKSRGQKLLTGIKSRRGHSNNNEEASSCGEVTSATPKRRLSGRLPSYRRNAVRRRGTDSMHRNSITPTKRDQRNNRALKMILLVVVVFAVFMLPMQIMSLLLDFGGKPTPEKYKIYAWFVMCSYFGSCTLNPFIYGLVDRTFRAGFKKIGKKIAHLCACSST